MVFQKAKQWKRLYWNLTNTCIGTKSKNCIIPTFVIDIFLPLLLDKKCAINFTVWPEGIMWIPINSSSLYLNRLPTLFKIRSSNLKSHPHYGHSSKIQWSIQQTGSLARQKPELLTWGIFAKTHISLTLLLDYTIHVRWLKRKKNRQVIFSLRLQIQAPEFMHVLRIYE